MGVTYLLDTHVVAWLVGPPQRVADPIRADLADPGNTVLVSAASALEIATKHRIGQWQLTALVEGW